MVTSFYSDEELNSIGFKSYGINVKISRKASIYSPEKITIGNNVRIDDFCVLSAGIGGIEIGNYVHIAIYTSLQGKGKIKLEDFSGLSSKVSIYSSSDDYSGQYMTNPCVPEEYTNLISGDVIIKKHVIVGCGSVILPNVIIGEGSAIGALSLVIQNIPANVIAIGIPARGIENRNIEIFNLEQKVLNSENK